MTSEFKDFDVLMQRLTGLLAHVRSCPNSSDLGQWANEGFKGAIEVLQDIEANLDINLTIMTEVACVCPVCVAAKAHIEACKAHVSDLRTRMSKYTSDFQNPLEAMLLLGTTTTLLVTVPDLIEAMSELAQEAHDMCRAVIESKIVSIGVEDGGTTDNEPGNNQN